MTNFGAPREKPFENIGGKKGENAGHQPSYQEV